MKLETEVRSKNTPAITVYAIGAVKDDKIKIFEIITLSRLKVEISHCRNTVTSKSPALKMLLQYKSTKAQVSVHLCLVMHVMCILMLQLLNVELIFYLLIYMLYIALRTAG